MQSFSWKVLYEAVIFKANLLTPVSNSFHYRLVVFIYFFQSLHCLWDVLCYYFPALSLYVSLVQMNGCFYFPFLQFLKIIYWISFFILSLKQEISNNNIMENDIKGRSRNPAIPEMELCVTVCSYCGYWCRELYLRCGCVFGSAF